MPVVELIPLNKGNQITLDNTIITTIGRTPNIGCLDNKISRNHVQLFIKSDGTVWLKPIHHNPTFYKTKTNQIVSLTKNKEYQLYNNDQFGLLPDEYFYRVSIKSENEEKEKTSDQNHTINSSTIPKSPVKEKEILTIENHDDAEESEPTSSTTSNKTRALPTWISNSSVSSSKHDKEQSKEKTATATSVKDQTCPGEKRTKGIAYDIDDGDDDKPTAATSSTVASGASNDIDLTTNNQTSSSVIDPVKRERCPYGESCYRKNLIHRQQAIHPGDPDWDIEENEKNKTKPECPYGNECYRKNADHLNEYHHPKKRCIPIKNKRRATKRKSDEDDDDGLPNEYDYNDSFIDDENLGDSDTTNDEEETSESDHDIEWKPDKKSRYWDETEDGSTDDSERDLAQQEATEFVKGSNSNHHGPVIKKPRRDEDDDDDDD